MWTEWYPDGKEKYKGNYKDSIKDGAWTEWYPDGTEKSKGTYKSGIKDDAWTFSYENGQKSSEGAYISGSKDGVWTEWYDNGAQKSEGNYKNDFRFGAWTWWYDNETKEAEGTFKGGKDWSYVYLDSNPNRGTGDGSVPAHYLTIYGYSLSGHYFPGTWIEGIADGKWTFWHTQWTKVGRR